MKKNYVQLLFAGLSLTIGSVSSANDGYKDPHFELVHELQLRPAVAFIANSVGFQVDAVYLSRDLSQSVLPFLENERIGFGLQYLRIKSSNSIAQAQSIFLTLEADHVLRRMLGTLPLYGVLNLGLSQVSIEKQTVSSGIGFFVSPEMHYRFPAYFDGISSGVFVGYSAVLGSQSLFSTSFGLSLGYQF